MPGTGSGGFNTRKTKSFAKAKREKARHGKKRAGAKQKHIQVAVKAVSGSRTKKHQRRVAHQQRLQQKEQEALESMMDVESTKPTSDGGGSSKKAAKKSARRAAKKTGTPAAASQPKQAPEAAAGPAPMQA